jgi:catechol 2,3-dioxygenase-like lactoylglutathione lyase family enzyme
MCYFFRFVLVVSSLHAQTTTVPPHVRGLAHVAFRVSDLGRTGAFYKNALGFAEPISLGEENGQAAIALVKVHDQQYVELLQGDASSRGQLDHFALYTDDITAMRNYLSAHGIPLVRDIHQGRVGNPFFTVSDPDGHPLEILQYVPTSLTGRSRGQSMPGDRASARIAHVGIVVRSEGTAMKFYRDVLGFREIARGGRENGKSSWIDLQAPDGDDVIELIPFAGVPSAGDLKAMNHLCLASPDVRKTAAAVEVRLGASSSPHVSVQAAVNGLPARAELSDPDGARIEIMESVSAGTRATAGTHSDR